MNQENNNENCSTNPEGCKKLDDLFWWVTLLVAVLAVPSIGAVVALMAPVGEFGQMVIFVITCWMSVWAGMWLMRKSYEKNQ